MNKLGQSFVALAPAESIATVHVTRVKGASQTHPKQSIKHPHHGVGHPLLLCGVFVNPTPLRPMHDRVSTANLPQLEEVL